MRLNKVVILIIGALLILSAVWFSGRRERVLERLTPSVGTLPAQPEKTAADTTDGKRAPNETDADRVRRETAANAAETAAFEQEMAQDAALVEHEKISNKDDPSPVTAADPN